MELNSYAKINLGLTIKRYSKKYQKHRLQSLFLLIDDYCDNIKIDLNPQQTIVQYFKDEQLLKIENDLISKTIAYFQTHFKIRDHFKIKVKKSIPMGAGLGGSSSNAGCIINYLIETYSLSLSASNWLDIAINLGSDVAFFASGYKMALVSGYGQKISVIDKPAPKYQILSNDLKCSTTAIYQNYRKNKKFWKVKTKFWDLIELLPDIRNQKIINDLQASAFLVNPSLLNLYREFEATRKIFLTGSGSFFVELI